MALTYLEIDDGRLAIELLGQEGSLVICSPGMGDTRDSYRPFADILIQRGFQVAMMDSRGHGDSSVDFKQYGDEATAEDFILAASTLSPGRPVVLAGTSFSAGSAVIAAGKRPDLIAGIVLLGAFIRNPQGMAATIGMKLMPTLFANPWGPAVWKSYAATLWPGLGEEAKVRADQSKASLTRPGRWRAFQTLIKSLDHSVVSPWIPKVKAAVLVVMGEKDPDWSDPVEEAKWIASQFVDSELEVVSDVGHAPALERPQIVADATLKFLDKLHNDKTGSFKL